MRSNKDAQVKLNQIREQTKLLQMSIQQERQAYLQLYRLKRCTYDEIKTLFDEALQVEAEILQSRNST